MSAIDDGGPAFQHIKREPVLGGLYLAGGMTLRDWFAGQALPAIMENVFTEREAGDRGGNPRESIADRAYAFADAMLAARSQALVEEEGR